MIRSEFSAALMIAGSKPTSFSTLPSKRQNTEARGQAEAMTTRFTSAGSSTSFPSWSTTMREAAAGLSRSGAAGAASRTKAGHRLHNNSINSRISGRRKRHVGENKLFIAKTSLSYRKIHTVAMGMTLL